MTDQIRHLQVLHNNPFIFGSAFIEFFEALGTKEKALLLGYLVLPMILHQPSHKFLSKANSRSSLRTMLQDCSRIYGLNERVTQYRQMTRMTVQYLLGTGGISVHSHLDISVNQQVVEGPSPAGVIKAARQLGTFFRPYDVPTVFRMLGVMSL